MNTSLKLLFLIALVVVLSSCDTSSHLPDGVTTVPLGNSAVYINQSQSLDIDGDGDTDLSFVTVLTQEDGTTQLHYRVFPTASNRVFEVGGRALMLTRGQLIEPGNPFDKNVAPLVTRVEATGSYSWQGDWLHADNHYLGFLHRMSDGGAQYGWVRLSFDRASEKLILHEFGYRIRSNQGIAAGQKELN